MGVIRKIAFSLLMVATLAHGQLSVDLNGGNITAPLQHQGKIEQQHFPENIDRTYAQGQLLDENIETGLQDPTTNSKNLHRSTTNNQSNLRNSVNSRLDYWTLYFGQWATVKIFSWPLSIVLPKPIAFLIAILAAWQTPTLVRTLALSVLFGGTVTQLFLFLFFPDEYIMSQILYFEFTYIFSNPLFATDLSSGKNLPIFNGGRTEGGDRLSSRMMAETLLPMVYQAFDKFGAVDTAEELLRDHSNFM